MSKFTLHTIDNAPDNAKPLLKKSEESFGMVPNLHAVMAESPALLEGYQALHALAQKTSFSKEELTVVWQTVNVEHRCHYCVPAHTAIAKDMGVDDALIDALRNEEILSDTKLNALKQFTLSVVLERGNISDNTLQKFLNAGYAHQQVLDVILIVSQKVMSNYVNHLADTPLDKPFAKYEWKA